MSLHRHKCKMFILRFYVKILIYIFVCSQLTAAIVFLSFGIITSFFCVVIDGVCVVLNMVSYLHLHVYSVTLDIIVLDDESKQK